MGQAKQKGTYEERLQAAQARRQAKFDEFAQERTAEVKATASHTSAGRSRISPTLTLALLAGAFGPR